VVVSGADALSHVIRHEASFARQVWATHTAIEVQAGSLGQLAAPQQLATTQLAHDEPAALKISAAPGQLPASLATTPASSLAAAPPSPCGDEPPPFRLDLQGAVAVGVHEPSCGGIGLLDEEQATIAVSAAAAAAPGHASLGRGMDSDSPSSRGVSDARHTSDLNDDDRNVSHVSDDDRNVSHVSDMNHMTNAGREAICISWSVGPHAVKPGPGQRRRAHGASGAKGRARKGGGKIKKGGAAR
jgi:hypothetical protein